jgi:hypothetical protein
VEVLGPENIAGCLESDGLENVSDKRLEWYAHVSVCLQTRNVLSVFFEWPCGCVIWHFD